MIGSIVFMVLGSLITPRPAQSTIDRYFPAKNREGALAVA
jgi:hypothetical protein